MSAKPLAWSRTFDDPLLLPDGRMLRTPADAAAAGEGDPPADAGHYAAALAEAVQQRTAAEMLITAAKGQRPVMFAHIAMRLALHAGKPVLPWGSSRRINIGLCVRRRPGGLALGTTDQAVRNRWPGRVSVTVRPAPLEIDQCCWSRCG